MLQEILAQAGAFLSDSLIYIAIALVVLIGVVKCIYPVLRNSSL